MQVDSFHATNFFLFIYNRLLLLLKIFKKQNLLVKKVYTIRRAFPVLKLIVKVTNLLVVVFLFSNFPFFDAFRLKQMDIIFYYYFSLIFQTKNHFITWIVKSLFIAKTEFRNINLYQESLDSILSIYRSRKIKFKLELNVANFYVFSIGSPSVNFCVHS